ncbi:MAG: SIMPL domain-containing protein [Novosphingobium sp.]
MQRSTKLVLLGLVPLLLGATLSGDDAEAKFTRLSLSGKGYATQAAEFVTVSAATETFSTSASQAMSGNASDMNRLQARLGQMGVAKEDFRTANFAFRKGRNPDDEGGSSRTQGFVVQHRLAVTIRNPDKAGAIMDALVTAGAKNLSVNRYWGYSGEVRPEVLKEARAGAIRDAQTKADDYARALGLRVRRIVSITDQGGYSRDEPARMAPAAIDESTSIATRPSTVLASVGMVFELEK